MEIYNSMSRSKVALEPMKPGKLGIYVCGMTVYDYCHLGHARVLVSFDVITRYFRHLGLDVTYVRNITDVDDKIIRRAQENDETVAALTERFIEAMHEDERALGVLSPDQEPRATGHMAEMIDMIQRLIEKGAAYAAENGDVYYAIDAFGEYGKLSGRKVEELRAGARVEVEGAKRNPLDFVLWKAAKAGEISWPSPWGDGRPGWHIECSAMSEKCLGKTFDIHGGGPDLLFPHHENEIAQSEAANGCQFARHWMHAGPVRVNDEKMSKSLGNFFTIREVLKDYAPEVVRYFIVASHYRSPIDYNENSLREAKAALTRFYHGLREIYAESGIRAADCLTDSATLPDGRAERAESYVTRFRSAMEDDFNTPSALSVLFELVKDINQLRKENHPDAALLGRTLVELAAPLGLLQQSPESFFQGGVVEGLSADEIGEWIEKRKNARSEKNWAESDRIRDWLLEQGVELNDTREGTTWSRVD